MGDNQISVEDPLKFGTPLTVWFGYVDLVGWVVKLDVAHDETVIFILQGVPQSSQSDILTEHG